MGEQTPPGSGTMMCTVTVWVALGLLVTVVQGEYGGMLSQLATANRHYMEGEVVVKDENTIEIRNFSYPSTKTYPNGRLGPDAFFIAGTEGCGPDQFLKRGNTDTSGIIIPLPFPQTGQSWDFEDFSIPKMRAAVNEKITLKLPPGVEMEDLMWLSLWCRRYKSNFGQVLLNSKECD